MRNRSGVPGHDEDIAGLSLEQLNAQIARRLFRMKIARTAYGRKASFKQIVRLEKERESRFGVLHRSTVRARSN